MEPIELPNMLLIAGSGRNTGKTTLACNIIRKFSPVNNIIALKITPHFHKNIQSGKVLINTTNLFIAEETNPATGKDSSLMLGAGARQSFFVMASDENFGIAVREICRLTPPDALIVCESGGLRYNLIPGIFLMINHINSGMIKHGTEKLKLLTSFLVTFDGVRLDFDLDKIEITDNRWTLKQSQYDTF